MPTLGSLGHQPFDLGATPRIFGRRLEFSGHHLSDLRAAIFRILAPPVTSSGHPSDSLRTTAKHSEALNETLYEVKCPVSASNRTTFALPYNTPVQGHQYLVVYTYTRTGGEAIRAARIHDVFAKVSGLS